MRSLGVALVALASWPIWSWYARRMQDGSDDPWGLLALVPLGALLAGERHERARDAAAVPRREPLRCYELSRALEREYARGN